MAYNYHLRKIIVITNKDIRFHDLITGEIEFFVQNELDEGIPKDKFIHLAAGLTTDPEQNP